MARTQNAFAQHGTFLYTPLWRCPSEREAWYQGKAAQEASERERQQRHQQRRRRG